MKSKDKDREWKQLIRELWDHCEGPYVYIQSETLRERTQVKTQNTFKEKGQSDKPTKSQNFSNFHMDHPYQNTTK